MIRTTYPCAKCLRRRQCERLLRALRLAVAGTGLDKDAVPDIVVDCTRHFIAEAHKFPKVPIEPDRQRG